jgi:hypothetical protein
MLISGVRVDLFIPDKVHPSLTINPQCTIHKIPVLFKNPILRLIAFNILLIINFLFEITKNAKPDMIYARQIYSGIILFKYENKNIS